MRRKTLLLAQALLGLFVLALLVIPHFAIPAMATEPTPTPTPSKGVGPSGEPVDVPCHLGLTIPCDFVNRIGVAKSGPTVRTNPAADARGVPAYTLVSATFNMDMDASTITTDTFYLSQGAVRLDGSVAYINVSKVAVFHPAAPLSPSTPYTATLTTGIHDLAGQPLPAAVVWTFTTSSGASPLGDGMNIYFGDLHNHSGYSDGVGAPVDAFATARANGLDFFAQTEHAFMLTAEEWQDMLAQASAATVNGAFVGLRGFEFTHPKGHINVFNTDTYVNRDDPNYDTLEEFYAWLAAQPAAIGQFNHPLKNDLVDWNFNDFAYPAPADQKIALRELSAQMDQFSLSLNAGWHLGTLVNADTHDATWGCCRLMGLLAPNLTREAILGALRARRTFFVTPSDRNFALVMKANGYWMGAAIPETATLNFTVIASDPDPSGSPLRMILYDNGLQVAEAILPGAEVTTWAPSIPGAVGHYYYVEAQRDGWVYPAYSSPVWVERPPLAEAGRSRTVPVNAVVTLDGGNSWDPDGNELAYQWVQAGGPAVGLNGINTALAAFTAPGAPAELAFRLTVTDTGSLSASAVTTVAVTDKPILSITKSGPATTAPGELITYVLTVTNSGITDALDVVITDAVPAGATYVGGGTLLPGDVVGWTTPNLAANGGVIQTTFSVRASQGIVNADYRASCPDCLPAQGDVAIHTNWRWIYLPSVVKQR